MSKHTGGSACSWCIRPAHIKQGRIMLCQMHYRISSMRSNAKRHGKAVPSREQIEAMIPSPFECSSCNREMTWVGKFGASQKATLQHDRSGSMRIICLGCNTRHAHHPGDTFYDIPDGKKLCPDCSRVLPISSFCKDKSRPIGVKSYCRECSSVRNKIWRNGDANSVAV